MNSIKINQNRKKVRKKLIRYLKEEVMKGHYPTRRYLERRFKINLAPVLFASIKDLYQKAGLYYKQKSSQELKNKKANILSEMVIDILPKLNLDLIESKSAHQQGIDILTKDKNNKVVGIELKAHNKYEPIKERNILQLKRFLEKYKLDKLILVTTSSRFHKMSKINNLEIIDYYKLRKLCNDDQLSKLHFIRNESVHQETKEKQIKRQRILDYAKRKAKQGKDINHRGIAKDLNLHPFTYFDSINQIYQQASILPPLRKIGGRRNPKPNKEFFEKIILKILDYMREEITNGHYPSGIDVGKKLGVKHIWNYVTMGELYNRLGLSTYHKRKLRGPRH